MSLRSYAMVIAASVVSAAAPGDTVYLNNGTQVDGKVSSREGGVVRIEVRGRTILYQASEVSRVEQNDKLGGFDKKRAQAAAAERDAELTRLTGLTSQDRAKVKKLMQDLQSTDHLVANEAVGRMIALGKTMDLVKYFEYWLPSLSPRFTGRVLEVVFVLDTDRARALLREQCTNVDGSTRAKALELLAKAGDKEAVDLLVRGMVDEVPEVQAAAASGLGVLRATSATPVLLTGLRTPDVRVRSASRTALSQMWSTEGAAAVDFNAASAWEQFWQEKAPGIPNAYHTEALTPLVPAGARFQDE